MILAIVLLHTAITGFSSSAAVLDGKGIEASECSEEDCATLYLLTSTGEEIPIKKTISKRFGKLLFVTVSRMSKNVTLKSKVSVGNSL